MEIWTHRGLPGVENTLQAFKLAYDDGIRKFETDIHATKDGKLVLSHDPDLRRLCGNNARIQDLTLDELTNFSILGHGKWCTLDELTQEFESVEISIDIKNDYTLQPFLNWLKDKDLSRLVIGSFSHKRVSKVRAAFPQVKTALTSRDLLTIKLLPKLFLKTNPLHYFAMVPISAYKINIVNKKFVKFCQDSNIQVHVWVVNSAELALTLSEIGVNGIVTDRYQEFI